jgi:uncharacterized iron-regulated membrane protein
MKQGFRQSMAWLHTWAGVLLGWLLFAVFLTGTIAYFRHEVTLWMQPELHRSHRVENTAEIALERLSRLGPEATEWSVSLPDDRGDIVNLSWSDGTRRRGRRGGEVENTPRNGRVTLDAATGDALHPRETAGGNFLYRFHFELYGLPRDKARLIVGIATAFMFVAIISGIITHKKIFTDFFTFRPRKGQRSWLDLHNLTAVLALPFHLMITYSGLLLFIATLLPLTTDDLRRRSPPPQERVEAVDTQTRGERRPGAEARGRQAQAAAAKPAIDPAVLQPITRILETARTHWREDAASFSISLLADGSPVIDVSPQSGNSLSRGGGGSGGYERLRFDGRTGASLDAPEQPAPSTARAVFNVFGTLHRARFADLAMRWLFFVAGSAGTIMMGTGLLLWVAKRRAKLVKTGATTFPIELVDRLNIAAITGLTIATGAYFWANRLVPTATPDRADWEIGVFFTTWAVCAIHPFLRSAARAWKEQLMLTAGVLLLLPVVNALTVDTHLGWALWHGRWRLASVDIVALLIGIGFACALWFQMRRKPVVSRGRKPAVKPAAATAVAGAKEV